MPVTLVLFCLVLGVLMVIDFLPDLSPGFDELVQVDPLLFERFANPVKCLRNQYFCRFDNHPIFCLDKGDEITLLELQLATNLERDGHLTFLLHTHDLGRHLVLLGHILI